MVGFLTSMSVGRKLILISLSLLLPLGVVVYLLLDELGHTIRNTRLELDGIAYQRPFVELLDSLGQHQLLAREVRAGVPDKENALHAEQQRVNEAINSLEAVQRRLGATLQLTEQTPGSLALDGNRQASLKQGWDELIRDLDRLSPQESDRRHRLLRAQGRATLFRLAGASKLILDPDLNSNYLVEIAVTQLPTALACLTDLRSDLVFPESSRPSANQDELIRLAQDAALLRQDRDYTTAAFLEAQRDPEAGAQLEDQLKLAMNAFTDSTTSLLKEIEVVLKSTQETSRQNEEVSRLQSAGFAQSETPEEVGASKAADDTTKLAEIVMRTREAGFQLWKTTSGQLDRLLNERIREYYRRQEIGLALTGLVLAFAAILVLLTGRSITQPLRRCVEGLQALADRNLTHTLELRAGGEPGAIASAVDRASANLRALIGKIQHTSVAVMTSANEFTANSRQQQHLADEYRHSTNETAVAVAEITSTSHELVHTMNDVHDLIDRTADIATIGRIGLAEMESSIVALSSQVESLGTQLAATRQRAENINLMVTTIIKVADETNLLSINAAIEAEKAGEHGRGFSVVAREIRRLADQTAHATLDIEGTVAEMHKSLASGTAHMSAVLEGVRRGVGAVHRVSDDLTKIVESIHDLTPRFHLVHDGMTAQSRGAEQIREAMLRLSDNAQHALVSLQEFNRATDDLRESVQSLNQDVSLFLLPGMTARGATAFSPLPQPRFEPAALPSPDETEGMPDFSSF